MKDIRLMNRIDTKFVTTESVLRRLLEMAAEDYFVQETDGLRISPYYTLYIRSISIRPTVRCITVIRWAI